MGEVTFDNLTLEAGLLGQLHVDLQFGLTCWAAYQYDLAQRQAGFSVYEIGLAERRNALLSSVLLPTLSGYQTINDPKLINNAGLTTPGSIAHLKLSGFMQADGGLSNPGVTQLANDLRAAYSNPNISSIILEVNSGGGQMVAGDILRVAVSERNKPVIAYGWLIGSAAYNAVTGADEIIAANTGAEFGSLGAMYQMNKQVLAYLKENTVSVYSDASPGKNAGSRAAVENDDFSVFKKEVTAATEIFHQTVQASRPLRGNEDKIKSTLDGSMFFADEAKRRGLIDSIGNFNFAIARAKRWERMK
jgi:ClpP class serine protease